MATSGSDESAITSSTSTSGVVPAVSWESEALSEEAEARVGAHELLSMILVPHVVNAVHKLNIFEALAAKGAGASLTARELADLAVPHPNSGVTPGEPLNVTYLERMFRCLTTAKVFHETVTITSPTTPPERSYALTPLSRFFVKNGDGVSMGPLASLLMDPVFLAPWGHLHEAVADNTISPFKRAHGVEAWEYGKQDAQFDGVFNEAMYNHSMVCMRAVLDKYRGFEGLGVLVDVGGGFGSALALITKKYPNIKGINFDQPHVIAECKEVKGVEFVGGDMFDSVPSGDAIFMKWILHDWDDESNLKLLKNCYKALPVGGKVIVVDGILPEIIDHKKPQHWVPFRWDMQMLAYNSGGARERTEREVRELGLAAGFARVEVIVAVDPLIVIEMHKD